MESFLRRIIRTSGCFVMASSLVLSAADLKADYAEARAEDQTAAGVRVRNGAVQRLTSRGDSGWGLRVAVGRLS